MTRLLNQSQDTSLAFYQYHIQTVALSDFILISSFTQFEWSDSKIPMKHAPVISQEITQYVISVKLIIDDIDSEPCQIAQIWL